MVFNKVIFDKVSDPQMLKLNFLKSVTVENYNFSCFHLYWIVSAMQDGQTYF